MRDLQQMLELTSAVGIKIRKGRFMSGKKKEEKSVDKSSDAQKHSRKWLAVIIAALAILLPSAYFGYQYINAATVAIHTLGETDITLELGSAYTDKGAAAVVTTAASGSRKLDIETTGRVDTDKIGDYTLTYTAEYNGKKYTSERTVHVVDTEKPVITVKYLDSFEENWVNGRRRYKAYAEDNYDGDITDKIRAEEENGLITYTVSDSSGNTAEKVWRIPDEIGKPAIMFSDDSEVIVIYIGETLTMPEYIAIDGDDNDVTEYVEEVGTVDTNTEGTYEIVYTIDNNRGEYVSAVRTVIVKQRMNSNYILDSNKVIYLTFDGGPGTYTDAILDLFDKYNVKATFFVSCGHTFSYDTLLHEKRAGHTIGVLSYDTNYNLLYSDIETFEKDFEENQAALYTITGSRTRYMRFPGGSESNYCSDSVRMMELRSKYYEDGYTFYDWTIDSGDTLYGNSSETVYSNVVNNIRYSASNIVLMHDDSCSTLKALERIILWGIENGYTFSAII